MNTIQINFGVSHSWVGPTCQDLVAILKKASHEYASIRVHFAKTQNGDNCEDPMEEETPTRAVELHTMRTKES